MAYSRSLPWWLMDMIAERVKKTRDETFNEFVTVKDAEGKEVQKRANHTRAIFSLERAILPRVCGQLHQCGDPDPSGLQGPENLNGLFSGFDPSTKRYNTQTWSYQTEPAEPPITLVDAQNFADVVAARIPGQPKQDRTLQIPMTVFQLLKRSVLKARILNVLVWLDPEPAQIEVALEQIIALLGEPSGATRAVAVSVLEEWHAACASPQFVEWLLAQAVQEGLAPTEGHRRGRKNHPIPASPDSGTTGSH